MKPVAPSEWRQPVVNMFGHRGYTLYNSSGRACVHFAQSANNCSVLARTAESTSHMYSTYL